MKIIETSRLLLRRSTITEYKDVFENYTEEAAMAYIGATDAADFLEHKRKYEGSMITYRTSFVYFHLTEKTTGDIIGDCCFHTWYVPHSRAEIGYGLKHESHKNKGYMKEALAAVLQYGFTEMDLHRVEAFISPSNLPSQRLVLGAGFTQEGLLKEHYLKDGQYHDSMVFGLLKRNFTPEG